jgi:hypothetical protein
LIAPKGGLGKAFGKIHDFRPPYLGAINRPLRTP